MSHECLDARMSLLRLSNVLRLDRDLLRIRVHEKLDRRRLPATLNEDVPRAALS